MSSSLLHPPGHLPPAIALQLSQQAPQILRNSAGAVTTSALQALFAAAETPELWTIYENLLLSCLRTGDDESAHHCLGRLVNRFGDDNERIMALIGLVKEAEAADNAALEVVLKEYHGILAEKPTNIPVTKRRIALLRSMGKTTEAVTALNALLDFSPTDGESWSELSDIYFSQGLFAQSIYALDEVLVLQPNAWNIHARLGELHLLATKTAQQNEGSKYLGEALKRFSRSIELCDDYLRGYYGLKMTTQQLIREPPKFSKQMEAEGFESPDPATVRKLDELATKKLAEITRRYSAGEAGWLGYDETEILAAKSLLDKSTTAPIR